MLTTKDPSVALRLAGTNLPSREDLAMTAIPWVQSEHNLLVEVLAACKYPADNFDENELCRKFDTEVIVIFLLILLKAYPYFILRDVTSRNVTAGYR